VTYVRRSRISGFGTPQETRIGTGFKLFIREHGTRPCPMHSTHPAFGTRACHYCTVTFMAPAAQRLPSAKWKRIVCVFRSGAGTSSSSSAPRAYDIDLFAVSRNMPGERSTHEAPAVTSLSLNVISPYHRARRWCAWFTLSTSLPMYDCSALSRETSVSTRRTCPALDTGQNQVPISVTGMRPTPGTTLSMILVSFGSVCLSLLSIVQLVCGAIRPSTYRYHRRCPRG